MADSAGVFKDTVWIYGVLVGLAIKEALSRTVPAVLEDVSSGSWVHLVLGLRCLLFILLIARFFMGASLFFLAPDATARENRVTYGLSAFWGLLHFVLFSALAFTVDTPDASKTFFVLLLIVLCWDLGWWLVCLRRDDDRRIRTWAVVNVLTAVFAVAIYLGLAAANCPAPGPEITAFLPVVAVTVVDLAGIVQGKNFFQEFLTPIQKPPS